MVVDAVMALANVVVIHELCVAGEVGSRTGACLKTWGNVTLFKKWNFVFNGQCISRQFHCMENYD